MDRIRSEGIRGTVYLRCCGDKARGAGPRWFGHVQRKDVGIYLWKEAEVGTAWREVERKSNEEIYGCRT